MIDPADFDSSEELWFSWYLAELKNSGYILEWSRHETLQLAPSVEIPVRKGMRLGKRVLLREQTYTPDFRIVWARAADRVFVHILDEPGEFGAPFLARLDDQGNAVSTIEVKGGYIEHDESRMYSILSKWVMATLHIYVQRVVVGVKPKSIFECTFTPSRFLLTDKSCKPRKIHFPVRTLGEFVRTAKG